MSFDVYVGDRHVFNHTSNMGAFYAFVLDGAKAENPAARCDSRDGIFGKRFTDGLPGLHGLTVAQALPRVIGALVRAANTPTAECDTYDAPNGWGTWRHCVKHLFELRSACEEAEPSEVIAVSY